MPHSYFCRELYATALAQLPSHFHPELKGTYVETSKMVGGKNYHWVKQANGTVIWEGTACCKWHARALLVARMAEGAE